MVGSNTNVGLRKSEQKEKRKQKIRGGVGDRSQSLIASKSSIVRVKIY